MSGEKPDTFELVLHCLFVMPDYLAIEKRFDVLVLTLTLLINLVEHCEENRTLLLKTLVPQTNEDLFSPNSERKTAAEGLVQMFLEKEENAKREESKTGKYLTTLYTPLQIVWHGSKSVVTFGLIKILSHLC